MQTTRDVEKINQEIIIEEQNNLIDENVKYIESRFGKIKVNSTKSIFFPHGLIGISNKTSYCVTNFPNPNFKNFMILQSLEDEDLAFIVLPLSKDEKGEYGLIETVDIYDCCKHFNIHPEDVVVLLITTVQHTIDPTDIENKKISISVNIRAPIIIDSKKSMGIQYVFPYEKYKIKHEIK